MQADYCDTPNTAAIDLELLTSNMPISRIGPGVYQVYNALLVCLYLQQKSK